MKTMGEEKKIAIVGASRNREKYGNKAIRAFMEKGYRVFPVHPFEKEIEGQPVYRSVLEIPERVPLASFYIPASIGLEVIEEVARKEGMGIVYLNPGAESGELIRKGRALGLEIRDTCSIVAIGANPSRY